MCADFLAFDEGNTELVANGLPATCHFFLSTKGVDAGTAHTAGETLAAADLGEITGTGAGRKSQAEPAPDNGVITFAQMSWNTGAAINWPASVRSIVLATGAAAAGKAICAWNLQSGGAARDLSTANTTENVAPTLNVGKVATFEEGTIAARPESRPAGVYYLATDIGILYLSDGSAWLEIRRLSGDVPLGTIMPYAGSTAPSDTRFLLCNGAPISRSTYSDLFTLIGITYGAGDGTTTFNIPDLRGRVPVGVDGSAARLTVNDALGNSGGEEKHLQTVTEMPAHAHPFSGISNGLKMPVASDWLLTNVTPGGVASGVPYNWQTDTNEVALNAMSQIGGGLPHNNMQPHLTTQFICRVL